MPYLGNQAGNRFVASKAATQFSGDGSTTAFTLDHAVGSDEDILVSVDGVIQEPSVAYAVSNGTTLTFTGAPSNNSGNNIFVYYLFRTVGTVSHPNNGALSASTGTFTGDATVSGSLAIGTTSLVSDAKLAISSDNTESNIFLERSGSGKFDVAIANTSGSLSFKGGSNQTTVAGLTEFMKIDGANGAVTKPNQPIFLATAETTISLSTSFAELTDFSNAHVNIGSHYNTSNGRFTAPVAGTYQFAVTSIGTSTSDVYRFRVYKNGSSLNNFGLRVDTQHDGSGFGTNGEFCIVTTLAASDYISIFGRSDGGSDAYANSSYRYSYFRGHLMA